MKLSIVGLALVFLLGAAKVSCPEELFFRELKDYHLTSSSPHSMFFVTLKGSGWGLRSRHPRNVRLPQEDAYYLLQRCLRSGWTIQLYSGKMQCIDGEWEYVPPSQFDGESELEE